MNIFSQKPLQLSILFTADELEAIYQALEFEVSFRMDQEKGTICRGLALKSLLESGRKIGSRLIGLLSSNRKIIRLTLPLIDFCQLHSCLGYCPGSAALFFNVALGKIDRQVKQYKHIIQLDR